MILSRSAIADWYLRRSTVRHGLFRGLRLRSDVPNLARTKWAGTYERELSQEIGSILATEPKVIFDIGAAEGYYAVGLLRRLPGCRCIAWEAREQRRHLLESNALANGCRQRLEIRGLCTATHLAEAKWQGM